MMILSRSLEVSLSSFCPMISRSKLNLSTATEVPISRFRLNLSTGSKVSLIPHPLSRAPSAWRSRVSARDIPLTLQSAFFELDGDTSHPVGVGIRRSRFDRIARVARKHQLVAMQKSRGCRRERDVASHVRLATGNVQLLSMSDVSHLERLQSRTQVHLLSIVPTLLSMPLVKKNKCHVVVLARTLSSQKSALDRLSQCPHLVDWRRS